jgi:hypothetical protein
MSRPISVDEYNDAFDAGWVAGRQALLDDLRELKPEAEASFTIGEIEVLEDETVWSHLDDGC